MNARSAELNAPMFDVAERMILAPSGLDENRLSTVLGAVMSRGVDYADLYFQLSREESWSLEDGIVKEGSHSIEQGVGVRAISGEKTGFAYTDEVLLPALMEASDAARAIARSGGRNAVKAWQRPLTHRLYLPVDPLDAIRDEDKVAWLMRIDADTRRVDPRVKQVMASLAAVHEVILIATSDGTLTADVRPLVRVNVSVIVEQNGRREQGYSGGGGRCGLDELLRGDEPFAHGREAVRQALVNLEAVAAPAGAMTVVLGPGWPGILLHEAIGHGLEGDFNRKGTSAFSNRIGQKVAADEITVVDVPSDSLIERIGASSDDLTHSRHLSELREMTLLLTAEIVDLESGRRPQPGPGEPCAAGRPLPDGRRLLRKSRRRRGARILSQALLRKLSSKVVTRPGRTRRQDGAWAGRCAR